MTDTERGLLNAVLAAPEDNTPRLIYADWLEEHGQAERAEFIRIQIAIAGRPEGVNCNDFYCTSRDLCRRCCEYRRWCRREKELMPFRVWKPAFGVPYNVWLSPIDVRWHRGFIDTTTCTAQQWWDHGRDIVACHPVTQVVLSDREPHWHGGISVGAWQWHMAYETAMPFDVWRYSPHLILWDWYWKMPGVLGPYYSEYPTRQDALDALSAGVIQWARKKTEQSSTQ